MTAKDPTPTEESGSKRLSPKKWAEAEALWESGEMTIAELAKTFGVTKQAVTRHMKVHKIVKGAKVPEHKRAVADEVSRAVMDDAAILATRIRDTKEEHYKMASGLAKLTWAEILAAKQDKVPMSSILNNLKSLDVAMNVLKKAREERWAVLGLDRDDFTDEDSLPELVISELTAEQAFALRNRDEEELELVSEEELRSVRRDNGTTPDEDEAEEDDDAIVEEG